MTHHSATAAARIAGTSVSSILRAITRRTLRATREGRAPYRIADADLRAWISGGYPRKPA